MNSQRRQGRAAGVAQAHELGRFVKGFTGSVVYGFAQQHITANSVDLHQLCVTTGHQQSHKGKRRRIGAQKRRQQMPFQVMNTHQRFAQAGGQGTSGSGTDQQCAGQTRTTRIGNHIQLRQLKAGFVHHLLNQGQYAPYMVSAGEFGHHAAIGFVHGRLRVQGLCGQDRQGKTGVCTHQRHAGFVAGRFNAQYPHATSLALRDSPHN